MSDETAAPPAAPPEPGPVEGVAPDEEPCLDVVARRLGHRGDEAARRGIHVLRLAHRRRPDRRRGPPGSTSSATCSTCRTPGRCAASCSAPACRGRGRRLSLTGVFRRRRVARARDARDVRHRRSRASTTARGLGLAAAAAARRVRGHPAAQVVRAGGAGVQAVARCQGARRGQRARQARRGRRRVQAPGVPDRPSGVRDERRPRGRACGPCRCSRPSSCCPCSSGRPSTR